MSKYHVIPEQKTLWQSAVIDKDLTAPPASPSKGDRYLIASGASGDWAGQDGNIAYYDGTTWQFIAKKEGMFVWVKDEDKHYLYILAWEEISFAKYLKADGTVPITANWNVDGANTLYIDKTNGRIGIGTTNTVKQLTLTKDISLVSTTASYLGVIYKNNKRWIHDFHHPTGSTAIPSGQNVFIGEEAGNFTMGSEATVTGHASYNVGIGNLALYSNTLGHSNVAIGYKCLFSNTIGVSNVALGRAALQYNTEGGQNMAVGYRALQNNTTGNLNTGVGISALQSNKTGSYNVGIAATSLYENISGAANVAIGYQALYNVLTTNYNIGIGFLAGKSIADNSGNKTPSNCVYIGSSTKASTDGRTNEIVIGHSAIGEGSNTIRLGNTSITDVITSGVLKAGGYKSSDGSAGITQTINIKDFNGLTHTLTFKNGLLTAYSSA